MLKFGHLAPIRGQIDISADRYAHCSFKLSDNAAFLSKMADGIYMRKNLIAMLLSTKTLIWALRKMI